MTIVFPRRRRSQLRSAWPETTGAGPTSADTTDARHRTSTPDPRMPTRLSQKTRARAEDKLARPSASGKININCNHQIRNFLNGCPALHVALPVRARVQLVLQGPFREACSVFLFVRGGLCAVADRAGGGIDRAGGRRARVVQNGPARRRRRVGGARVLLGLVGLVFFFVFFVFFSGGGGSERAAGGRGGPTRRRACGGEGERDRGSRGRGTLRGRAAGAARRCERDKACVGSG